MKCSHCGQEVAPEAASCPYCGAALVQAPQPPSPPVAYYAPPPPQKSSAGLIIGLAVGIPVALFLCAMVVIAVLVLLGPRVSSIFGSVYNSLQ